MFSFTTGKIVFLITKLGWKRALNKYAKWVLCISRWSKDKEWKLRKQQKAKGICQFWKILLLPSVYSRLCSAAPFVRSVFVLRAIYWHAWCFSLTFPATHAENFFLLDGNSFFLTYFNTIFSVKGISLFASLKGRLMEGWRANGVGVKDRASSNRRRQRENRDEFNSWMKWMTWQLIFSHFFQLIKFPLNVRIFPSSPKLKDRE